jgi:hypothetical protein
MKEIEKNQIQEEISHQEDAAPELLDHEEVSENHPTPQVKQEINNFKEFFQKIYIIFTLS